MRPFETKLQEYNIFAYYAQYTFKKFEQEIWKNEPFLKLLIFKNILKILFIYGCASFSLVAESGGYSRWCAGFSLQWLLLLWSTGSRAWGLELCSCPTLEHRLNSCGLRALLLCGTWGLPGPGIKPVSPTLTGGFFTIEPSGKSKLFILYWSIAN